MPTHKQCEALRGGLGELAPPAGVGSAHEKNYKKKMKLKKIKLFLAQILGCAEKMST